MIIKNAEKNHLQQINEITNYSIINTNFNFNFEPKTLEDTKKWYYEHIEKNFPIIVCLMDNKVVGWASLSTFRDYRGYDKTVEVSVYVRNNYKRMGIGSLLLQKIEDEAKNRNFHAIVSVITGGNDASINLHKKFGYEVKCTFEQIGYKNNLYLDVIFLYKIL
ncbi:N-acetyltransferase family protein [uncultured Tyzzerella sp.]|uniref:GNAT family N-acetyltransferase n=1 Tax=uncultured Tyzzerella sp. TaxID=2321398 RepID=UPI0029421942|nr:N-acetyltransferase family protein [uncultured Tyzzerella sp.]